MPLTVRPSGPLDRGEGMPAPFLRRRQDLRMRHSRRRRLTLRALPLVGIAAAAGVLIGAAFGVRWYLLHADRFRLHHVAFTPGDRVAAADLRRVTDRALNRNIFTLDLDRIERDLQGVKWVASAKVKRVLPDRLFCSIEESVPMGLGLLHGRVQLLDGDGAPIDLYSASADAKRWSFPIFTGLDENHSDAERAQAARGYDFLKWLGTTHPGLAEEISEIDLSQPDRLALRLNRGGPVVRINPQDYGTNLDRWIGMRDWLAGRLGDGAYVDLRFRDRITFQPLVAKRN